MLVDSHCHLTSGSLLEETTAIVERAVEQGVTRLITIGTDLDDCPKCVALAEAHPEIYAAVGIHPTSVTEIEDPDWLSRIEELAQHPKVVAIGEIGLDYFHDPPSGWTFEAYQERQKDFFELQLELASKLKKNVVVHNRESWEDTVNQVLPYSDRLRAVFHCHTRPWEDAKPLIDRGHLISFTGIVTFKSAKDVQQAAIDATPGHFMVETDAPYLAPVPHRGKRCEPAFVRHTAEAMASSRGETLQALAEHTTETAEAFFGLPSP